MVVEPLPKPTGPQSVFLISHCLFRHGGPVLGAWGVRVRIRVHDTCQPAGTIKRATRVWALNQAECQLPVRGFRSSTAGRVSRRVGFCRQCGRWPVGKTLVLPVRTQRVRGGGRVFPEQGIKHGCLGDGRRTGQSGAAVRRHLSARYPFGQHPRQDRGIIGNRHDQARRGVVRARGPPPTVAESCRARNRFASRSRRDERGSGRPPGDTGR